MGQQEIMEYLKGKDFVTIKEISQKLKIRESNINENIRRLYNGGFLTRKTLSLVGKGSFSYKLR